METKALLMRKRSRSDANGQRAATRQVAGVIWYPGGPVDRRTYDRKDLSLSPFATEDRLSKKCQAASLESIQKKKREEDDQEEMRRLLKQELETLNGVGLGTYESEEALKQMTYEQIRGLLLQGCLDIQIISIFLNTVLMGRQA